MRQEVIPIKQYYNFILVSYETIQIMAYERWTDKRRFYKMCLYPGNTLIFQHLLLVLI